MTESSPRHSIGATAGREFHLAPEVIGEMRSSLPAVADSAVEAIVSEVPSYAGAFTGDMGVNIRGAVQLALGGFISLASGRRGADPGTPAAPAVEGAYQLGRGEARSGRSMEALLAAYRIGARVSWREMSGTVVRAGIAAETLAGFAELVFAYIDELSAASAAGHTDELASSGRVRQRMVDRLVRLLIDEAPADALHAAAERTGWAPPETLTAVLVPEGQLRATLPALDPATLQTGEDLPGLGDRILLLVPNAHGRRRTALLRALAGSRAVAGPARPWTSVRASYTRAVGAVELGITGADAVDTDDHLPELLLAADPGLRADLRARALAPLAELRPATAEKLTLTLRSWLLHQGRREEIAADLFVHPQTVRYRVGQLRELYGERLEDPRTLLELTLALA